MDRKKTASGGGGGWLVEFVLGTIAELGGFAFQRAVGIELQISGYFGHGGAWVMAGFENPRQEKVRIRLIGAAPESFMRTSLGFGGLV